ncbi:hypothetical protein [Agromyces seonyuensis]|uniref:Uncharacterized protein n=1 Tax=Agromyces seonyuensis TaxID=2662446 RepID=A0A6I4NUW7_9MICO|nr:hypothetical protein [Agromyces seonyuensis]MWB98168.1 hypothetical protein [Agromyces seonyuensis]
MLHGDPALALVFRDDDGRWRVQLEDADGDPLWSEDLPREVQDDETAVAAAAALLAEQGHALVFEPHPHLPAAWAAVVTDVDADGR